MTSEAVKRAKEFDEALFRSYGIPRTELTDAEWEEYLAESEAIASKIDAVLAG